MKIVNFFFTEGMQNVYLWASLVLYPCLDVGGKEINEGRW